MAQDPREVTTDVDVVIIGGGPAGSAAGGYLSKGGLDCLILERERFPRPHVGESLVPSTTVVFRELGFLDQMEAAGFPRKYGAAWTSDVDKPAYEHDWEGLDPEYHAQVRFEEREQEGVGQNYTYHVDRGKFDELLLRHAERLGASVEEEAVVREVDFDSEAPGVLVTYAKDGETRDVRARMVVDASGRRAFLGNRLGLKVVDPVFDQYAVHTWFEGFDRGEGPDANYIVIHFLPITNTWVWQIPITEEITSFGVVTQKKHFKAAKSDLEGFFRDCVARRPELEEKLKEARRIRDFTPEGDYSYAMTRFCGDRFVLIGDAARFVDPIFSSGVSIALTSARLASRDILAAAEAGDFSEGRFQRFEETMKRGTSHWYEFICLYYRLNVMFTFFLNDADTRLDVLRLLQGDVYDEERPPVLQKMRDLVTAVEQNPNHVLHGLLGDLTAEELRTAV